MLCIYANFPVNKLVLLVQASHLQEKDNFALLEQARIIYSAGFFLTASAESMLVAAKHAAANNKIYCVNISAPFLLQVCLGSCITWGLSSWSPLDFPTYFYNIKSVPTPCLLDGADLLSMNSTAGA